MGSGGLRRRRRILESLDKKKRKGEYIDPDIYSRHYRRLNTGEHVRGIRTLESLVGGELRALVAILESQMKSYKGIIAQRGTEEIEGGKELMRLKDKLEKNPPATAEELDSLSKRVGELERLYGMHGSHNNLFSFQESLVKMYEEVLESRRKDLKGIEKENPSMPKEARQKIREIVEQHSPGEAKNLLHDYEQLIRIRLGSLDLETFRERFKRVLESETKPQSDFFSEAKGKMIEGVLFSVGNDFREVLSEIQKAMERIK